MKILLADDEKDLLKALKAIFEREHYQVELAFDGEAALRCLTENEYDAAVLDVMMPRMNGDRVVALLRERKDATPVLLLTAKSGIEDRVQGLDAGADDYLVKPFATRELLARVRSLLRRSPAFQSDELRCGDLTLSVSQGKLSGGGASIALNHRELQLMELLMLNQGLICSTEKIIDRIWDGDAEPSLVWVNIGALRKKLAQLDVNVAIHSRHGLGYVLEENKAC